MTTRLEVIYWRDIPAQVIAKSGRDVSRVALSDRFQVAIDRAATKAGKSGTDEYLAEWRKVREQTQASPSDAALGRADAMEAEFTDEVLADYVANLAWQP